MKSSNSGSAWEASIKFLLTVFLLLPLCSCAQLTPSSMWESPELRDHPLVGRIWDSRSGDFISPQQFSQRIVLSDYLLLGEKHDNPDHHNLQRRVLELLQRENRLGQVTFEMMDSDKQPLLDAIGDYASASLSELKDYLQWDEEGWNWDFYGPLIQTAIRRQTPIRAGNISSTTMGSVYGGVMEPEVERVLGEEARQLLNDAIDESHCGMLPQSQFPAMARVQQARDAAMADSLLQGPGPGVAVLIAGNFHTRRDLGVPNYLLAGRQTFAPVRLLSLAFVEVQEGEFDPAAYLEQETDIIPYDLLWFTPSVGEVDYCAQMQQ